MQTPIVIQVEEKEWNELVEKSEKEGVSKEKLVLEAISEYFKTKE